jgi:hypothetical protein
MERGQATVYCAQTVVTGLGDTMLAKWAIEFKPVFEGDNRLGLKCKDRSKTPGAASAYP